MTIYRWQSGGILPDAVLEERLDRRQHASVEDWLKQVYPTRFGAGRGAGRAPGGEYTAGPERLRNGAAGASGL
jgi:hypothetical protein